MHFEFLLNHFPPFSIAFKTTNLYFSLEASSTACLILSSLVMQPYKSSPYDLFTAADVDCRSVFALSICNYPSIPFTTTFSYHCLFPLHCYVASSVDSLK